MNHTFCIYIAGHRGLVGSAILRNLHPSLFAAERPENVFLAAAKVGGIHANNAYPVDFINAKHSRRE